MGYYASWTEPQNGGNYPISAIHWEGLTHVAAAFYIPDGKGGWATGSFDDATAAALIAAAHANGKKAIASIGGSQSGAMFEGSSSATNLPTFLTNLEAVLAKGYDGLDIDWEGGNLTVPQDQALETALIDGLRTRSPNAILTMTAGATYENQQPDLGWYATVAGKLDQINLMTYGMTGTWQGWQSWHSSPLHWNQVASTPTGIDVTIADYLAAGVPAAKLGVGAGFYGVCYTAPVTAPMQALGASQIVASDGAISYVNVLSTYATAGSSHYDAAAEAPYLALTGSNPQKCTYISYEDPQSIAAKGTWVKAQGLGGVIAWQLAEGFVASGANVTAQNPLLEALRTSLLQ